MMNDIQYTLKRSINPSVKGTIKYKIQDDPTRTEFISTHSTRDGCRQILRGRVLDSGKYLGLVYLDPY